MAADEGRLEVGAMGNVRETDSQSTKSGRNIDVHNYARYRASILFVFCLLFFGVRQTVVLQFGWRTQPMQNPNALFANIDLPEIVPIAKRLRKPRRAAQTPQEKEQKQERLATLLDRKGRAAIRVAAKPELLPTRSHLPDSLPDERMDLDDADAVDLGDATGLYALFLNPYGKLKSNGLLLQMPSGPARLTWAEAKPPFLRVPIPPRHNRKGQGEMEIVPGLGERLSLKGKASVGGDIFPIGELRASDGRTMCDDAAIEFLRRLLENPGEVLATAGREMGVCVFCGRKLSDGRSARLGFGKSCAQKFGMLWGLDVEKDEAALAAAVAQQNAERAEHEIAQAAEDARSATDAEIAEPESTKTGAECDTKE